MGDNVFDPDEVPAEAGFLPSTTPESLLDVDIKLFAVHDAGWQASKYGKREMQHVFNVEFCYLPGKVPTHSVWIRQSVLVRQLEALVEKGRINPDTNDTLSVRIIRPNEGGAYQFGQPSAKAVAHERAQQPK